MRGPTLYRWLLRLFPVEFRERWGRDMEDLFRHRLDRAGTSTGRRAWVWARVVFDTVPHAAIERWRLLRIDDSGREGWFEMRSAAQDVRYAIRALVSAPVFSLVALATLALGIGASVATFSVVHAVLLRDLPYEEPGRLVAVWPEQNFNKSMVRLAEEASPALASVSGISLWTMTLTGEGEPLELQGALVPAHHFELLGVFPVLGRAFSEEEGITGNASVVVLSHDFWVRMFGAGQDVLGRTIQLAGAEYDQRTVIGVMPPGFRPVRGDPDVWVPLESDPSATFEADNSWFVNWRVARLSPGATVDQARSQIRAFAAALQPRAPNSLTEEEATTATVLPLREFTAGTLGGALWVALGAVSLVLLISCANVANLLLARGEARAHDLSMRSALGAGRRRVIRMLLVESGLLGLLGGGLGVLLSLGLVRVLVSWAPPDFPRLDEVGVSGPVLLYALAATLVATLLAGLVPAVRASGVDPAASLGGSTRAASATRRSRLSLGLVGAEVALAVMVAVGSGLMLRSLDRLVSVDPGLQGEGVLTFRPNPPQGRYPDGAAFLAYYASVLERVRALPGVESAGAIHILPGTTNNWSFPTHIEGVEVREGEGVPSVNFRAVWPGYFETVRIPLKSGRFISDADRADTERVVLVNQAFVDRYWPSDDPLDKELRLFSAEATPFRVAGVVADVRQHSRDMQPLPELYYPYEQLGWDRVSFWIMARTRGGSPMDHAATVQEVVWAVDPDVPIAGMEELAAVLGRSTATARFLTLLLGAFGGLAMVLGGIGVFGVTTYTVGRRTSEFGLRIALGSSKAGVLWSALRQSMAPVIAGLVVGLVGAMINADLLESMLYEVRPTDPLTYLGVALLLAGLATIASIIPAWQASQVDPMEVLNGE